MSKLRLLVVALAILSPAAAAAQSTFYEAYERGVELQGAGRYQEAREAFLAASALRQEPAERIKTYGLNFVHRYDPYFHLAQVEIELGLLDDAKSHLDRSATAGVTSADEIERLRMVVAEILRESRAATVVTPTSEITESPTTPRLRPSPTPIPTLIRVESYPTGAEVFVDGLLLGITPVSIPVEPGRCRVEVRLEGHEPQTLDHTAGRGSTRTLRFRLNRVPEPTRTPKPAQTHAPEEPTDVVVPPERSLTPTEPSPVEIDSRLPEGSPSTSMPMWIPLLLATVLGLVLLLWLVRRRRRHSQPQSSPPVLTSDTTIGLSGEISLSDDADQVFGDFTLKQVLGIGGMATTYHAKRTRDGMQVALKIPHEHLLREPVFVERFFREGELGTTVHHPNIVRIHEVGQIGNSPFIVMELVEGETLAERLEKRGPMALRSALEITRGIALALDYAHVKGIIHRDLKPANVMLLSDDSVKVMDFGIAHVADAPGLTATDRFLGTPLYSAPEAVTPTHVDHRADLYSLGIILYTMLSGRPPFEADSPLRLLEMHRDDSLPPFHTTFEVPTRVEELMQRLAAKIPAERFASAEELLAELNAILNEL